MGVMRFFIPALATTLALASEPNTTTFAVLGRYSYQHNF